MNLYDNHAATLLERHLAEQEGDYGCSWNCDCEKCQPVKDQTCNACGEVWDPLDYKKGDECECGKGVLGI